MTVTSPPNIHRRRSHGERGVAIVMTALLLIPLMVFAAYGVDLASWYSRISYLQKSADAAALAGTVWMPDLTTASTVACDSLRRNGIDCASTTDGIDVSIAVGSTANSLRVQITDNNPKRYFSQVIGHQQTLTRSAEAEYNLPIPLGSPLNYFGGNSNKNTFTRVDTPATNTVTWPANWNNVANPPTNAPCNVGPSGINLGRWLSVTSFDGAASNSGSTQCRWTVNGDPTTPTPVSVPPPDYFRRPPTNAPCNVFQGTSTNGRWTSPTAWDAGGRYTSGTGFRQCTWDARITRASSLLPFMQNSPNNVSANQPLNRPCNVGYVAANGNWATGSGGWNNTGMLPSGTTVKTAANGNQLCEWTARITSTPASTTWGPTGNQIDPTRSPGFWAMVEGPGTVNPNGDAYSPRCYTSVNCTGTPQNLNYRPTSDPDRGYWYTVKIPPGLSGNVDIQVYDAQFGGNAGATTLPANCSRSGTAQQDCVNGLANMTGDSSLNVSGAVFATEFRVFRQTNPFDFRIRTNVFTSSSGDTNPGSCWWDLREEDSFRLQWRSLCTLTGVLPGDLYLINVRTNDVGSSGSGVNAYALQACANGSCTAGVQPALYAYQDMGMFTNFTSSGSGPQSATFYLAEVGPQYAGKTLVVELWDPGDSSGQSTIFPMRPSATVPGPVVNVPAADCTYSSDPLPNASQTSSPGGRTGRIEVNHASDTSGSCGIISHNGSSSQFNGVWLRVRINVPTTYTCNVGINPVITANSCWWGIKYEFAAATTDVTTWQARIEGNPVHLTR